MFGRRPTAMSRWLPWIVSLPAGCGEHDMHLAERAAHLRDLDSAAQPYALALERIEQDGRAFAVFSGERRCCIQHRGLGAEPAERLRQFEALRAGADDDEVTRTLAHLGQRFGGEVRRIEEAGDRRQHRRGAGGDDKARAP